VEADRRWAHLTGVEPWAPCCTIRRVTRRGVTKTPGPLFRGYVFLRLDPAFDDFGALEAVKGAIGFMRHLGQPWPLLDQDMLTLRKIAAAKGGIIIDAATGRELKDWSDLPKDTPVKITGGVWQGWNGLFSERVNGRIEVLLDLFGRSTKTLISEALVMPA
jgi:transcription antitermination factor NusG